MARAGILYSHVAAAAARISEDGKNPTVDGVREALGGTGSKSTIAPLLRRWKEEHQGDVARAESGLPPVLIDAVKGIYESMQADFRRKLEQAGHAHQAEMQAAGVEAQRLLAECATLADDRTRLIASLENASEAIARLQAENQSLNVALAGMGGEAEGLRQRLSDRGAEVSSLNDQLKQARTQFEHYQEAAAARRAEDRQAAEQRIVRVEHDLASTRQYLARQQTAAAEQAGQLARVELENARLQDAAQAAREEVAGIRLEREQFAFQARELTAARNDLQSRQDNLHQDLADARTALAVQAKELTLMAERAVRAESESVALANEKLLLLQQQASLQAELRQSGERPARMRK